MLNPGQRAKYQQQLRDRAAGNRSRGSVWVLDEQGAPKRVPVLVGISDNTSSEIISGKIAESDQVIVDVVRRTR